MAQWNILPSRTAILWRSDWPITRLSMPRAMENLPSNLSFAAAGEKLFGVLFLYSSSVHSSRPGRCFEVLTAKSSTVISCLVPPAVIAYYLRQSSLSPRSTERPQDAEYSPPRTAPSKMNGGPSSTPKVCRHFTYRTTVCHGFYNNLVENAPPRPDMAKSRKKPVNGPDRISALDFSSRSSKFAQSSKSYPSPWHLFCV